MKLIEEIITPSIAKELLKKNDSNRRVKKPVVLRYSNDIKNGRWKIGTAEPIKIGINGKVLDGQHRLLAVIHSNTPVIFLMAYGLNEDVFDVIDTGSTRSSSDVFKIAGIKNDASIPSIINTYNILKISYQRNVQKHNKLTNAQLLDQYNLDPEFWQFVYRKTASWYIGFAKILPGSTIGGLFVTFYEINQEQAIDFMDQLCNGINIKNPSIDLLRKRLLQERLSNKKTSPMYRNILIIKVWNYYRTNQFVKILKFDSEKEEFPKPI